MEYFNIALKLIVGLSLLNVWLIQNKKPTKWRGGNAQTLNEEFSVYGLNTTMLYVVGFFKVGCSLTLLASIYWIELEYYSALVLAVLLTGSIIMHIKISDPLFKSFPAALFLVLCLVIALV
ncbi:DoxX family protein [Winogradskyella sp. UBA3174]|uniref:DoxX family protein n=1 Tax=Winogradskyella sp. UBA3174 TaxID=1947785 RepID=UPI0025ECD4A7|nr:DoxX family protein [Winogradskyella sp. UBA3174]|tara:strand:+ start:9570 stop:9932 length:363 start_codon:yes stop_codon:yes gene_type:complete